MSAADAAKHVAALPLKVRKISPIVKARGFEFRICELLSTQKVEGKRGGTAVEQRWKIIGVFDTHVGAKNALAKLEEDERLFDTERATVKFFCGHVGDLDHKLPKAAGPDAAASLRTAFALRNERATQMPCLKCFNEMGIADGVAKWHALLNAPNEWREVEALPECPTCKGKLGEHHAQGCTAHSGQVLPSECPGYVESVTREVLAARASR